MDGLEPLRRALRAFVEERDWDRFHSPRSLAVSVSVEAAELLERFQWDDPAAGALTGDASRLAQVRRECADVFLYTLLLADKLGFDLVEAATEKLEENRAKYPADRARGSARKYTEL